MAIIIIIIIGFRVRIRIIIIMLYDIIITTIKLIIAIFKICLIKGFAFNKGSAFNRVRLRYSSFGQQHNSDYKNHNDNENNNDNNISDDNNIYNEMVMMTMAQQ
jgi:hypothetical protein